MSRWVLTAALLVGGAGCYQRAGLDDESMAMDHEGGGSGTQAGAGQGAGGGLGGNISASGAGGRTGSVGASGAAARTAGTAGGGSGVAGQVGPTGASGVGGRGGPAGNRSTQLCSDKQLTREQWCQDDYADCELSRDELLAQACRPNPTCSEFSCAMIVTAANGCRGSSIQITYGVDVAFVVHHYDEHGLLIGGLRRHVLECRPPQGGNQYTFGEQCAVTNEQLIDCKDVAADGGA